ncbi:MAG: rod shape-determining protein MreC [Thermodesulfobacteriota bacterium]|nr:rod shape-determining protein MreC [Thermodesulfobacteriota bacterium]
MRRKGEKVFLVSIFVILILIMISVGSRRYSTGGFDLVREGYYWVETVVSVPFKFFCNIWNNYIYLVDTKQENALLKRKLSSLRTQYMCSQGLEAENKRLRSMLKFKRAYHRFKIYPASVFSQDISRVFKTMIIDKGDSDGFIKDMPIVNPGGIVGRVIATSPHTSQVLLITDPNSAIPALIKATRVKGIVKGGGDGILTLEYIRRSENLDLGEEVVTSGLLGIFPKGLKIGYIKEINRDEHKIFAEITLTPSVEINKIEDVFGIESCVEDSN